MAPSLLAVGCVLLLPSNFLHIHYFWALLYMYVREKLTNNNTFT